MTNVNVISGLKILLMSFQFDFFFQFVRLLHFRKSYMNTKLTFEVGPGAPNFSGAPWPMWS